MFNALSERLQQTFRKITGKARLTEDNIQEILRDIRVALLEADVALPVIKDFLENVKDKSLGHEVQRHLNPSQAFLKNVQNELTSLLGGQSATLKLNVAPPAKMMLVGLQGTGKTTTLAKLAKYLQEKHKKTCFLTSTDIYRPAAIEQLHTLCKENKLLFHEFPAEWLPLQIAKDALVQAPKKVADVVLFDTAGRLHIDEPMMTELQQLHQTIAPQEIFLVVDAMTGQDALHIANAFMEKLPLTGLIFTKMDGDARGGAVLSVSHLTKLPIKFIGTGEKSNQLDLFDPARITSRILGMGDMLSLIEKVESNVDLKKAKDIEHKLKKGGGLNFNDLLMQLEQLEKLGGLRSMLQYIPGAQAKANMLPYGEKELKQMRAIIQSMTLKERKFPHLIDASRKKRISMGSGTTPQQISRLGKNLEQMQKMFKKFGNKNAFKQMFSSFMN